MSISDESDLESVVSQDFPGDYQDASMSATLDNDFRMNRLPVPNVFENKLGLAEDLKYLSRMPELCDVTFLVGEIKEPVCAVRAILAARSRVFHKLLYTASRGCTTPKKRSNPESRFKMPFLGRRNSLNGALVNGDTDTSGTVKCPRTITVEEFDVDVFRQLIEYCHTGCVVLNADTVLGLMNASDHYGLDELRRVCLEYMHKCISLETVCLLLRSAERYIQYKATKSLVQKALEFVDEHGEDVLRYPAFLTLPQHVVRLILSRDELQADELCKFQAALKWSRRYVRKTPGSTVKMAMKPFIDTIAFHLIPTAPLMQDVRESNVVPDEKILTALAFQADPSSIDPSTLTTTPLRLRLSMLSLSLQDHSGLYDNLDEASTETSSYSSGSDSQTNSNMPTPKPLHNSTFKRGGDIDEERTPTNSALEFGESDSDDVDDNNVSPVSTINIIISDNDSDVENTLNSNHDIANIRKSPKNSPSSSSQDLTKLNLSMLDSDSLRRKSIDEISNTTQSTNFDSVSSISMSTSSSSSESSGSFGRADGKAPMIKTQLDLPGMPSF
ncbi:LOW QUALITY PROTEIN: serine-enriched protein-like [Amphiura filiformis]|uniref:LOW QUALITY PROTEIN: serine-enriched protein-like n=1 Tax=Amphiura filiformis TaxID=82378 RepID=UPI003B2137CB